VQGTIPSFGFTAFQTHDIKPASMFHKPVKNVRAHGVEEAGMTAMFDHDLYHSNAMSFYTKTQRDVVFSLLKLLRQEGYCHAPDVPEAINRIADFGFPEKVILNRRLDFQFYIVLSPIGKWLFFLDGKKNLADSVLKEYFELLKTTFKTTKTKMEAFEGIYSILSENNIITETMSDMEKAIRLNFFDKSFEYIDKLSDKEIVRLNSLGKDGFKKLLLQHARDGKLIFTFNAKEKKYYIFYKKQDAKTQLVVEDYDKSIEGIPLFLKTGVAIWMHEVAPNRNIIDSQIESAKKTSAIMSMVKWAKEELMPEADLDLEKSKQNILNEKLPMVTRFAILARLADISANQNIEIIRFITSRPVLLEKVLQHLDTSNPKEKLRFYQMLVLVDPQLVQKKLEEAVTTLTNRKQSAISSLRAVSDTSNLHWIIAFSYDTKLSTSVFEESSQDWDNHQINRFIASLMLLCKENKLPSVSFIRCITQLAKTHAINKTVLQEVLNYINREMESGVNYALGFANEEDTAKTAKLVPIGNSVSSLTLAALKITLIANQLHVPKSTMDAISAEDFIPLLVATLEGYGYEYRGQDRYDLGSLYKVPEFSKDDLQCVVSAVMQNKVKLDFNKKEPENYLDDVLRKLARFKHASWIGNNSLQNVFSFFLSKATSPQAFCQTLIQSLLTYTLVLDGGSFLIAKEIFSFFTEHPELRDDLINALNSDGSSKAILSQIKQNFYESISMLDQRNSQTTGLNTAETEKYADWCGLSGFLKLVETDADRETYIKD
jgi:hypothetical protein